MKEISKLFKNVDKLVFMSSSMGNSEMDWNYSGTGKTSVICEDNKIFFLDRIIAGEYICGDDVYMGRVEADNSDIIFIIEIKSKKKNELIKYKYFK